MKYITKQEIEKLYTEDGLSIRACADVLGSTQGSVAWLLKKYNIPKRPQTIGLQSMDHPKGKNASGWKGGKQEVACNFCGKSLSRFPCQVKEINFCNRDCSKQHTVAKYLGQRFGMLVVIEHVGYNLHSRAMFKCGCDCGGERTVQSIDLLHEKVVSCGCLLQRSGEAHPSYNQVQKKCSICGVVFKLHPYRKRLYDNATCSKECRSRWMSESRTGANSPKWVGRVNIPCSFCGKTIERTQNRIALYSHHFCTDHCSSQWRAQNFAGKNNPNYRGGTPEMRKIRCRMSAGMRKAIKDQKSGRSWESFVDYGIDELIVHLKSTLPQGYSWEKDLVNASGVLHIDHIKPVSSFSFESPYDEGFRQCFALENLQLLPAIENMRKSGKLDYMQ